MDWSITSWGSRSNVPGRTTGGSIVVNVRGAITALGLLACIALRGTALGAQVPANETWRTIHTPHFNVHFTPPLEREARHAAAVAERAYANLARELVRPRGTIDLVLSDATDVSNGAATVIPRGHIVIYARPPVDEPSLESYDDWTALVLQHELTHVFQLDRTRGWWAVGQRVFGRNPVLFPEYYTPAWLTEGLAVYYESRYTSGGRLQGTYQSAVARAAAIDRVLPRLDQVSLATSRFPYGQSAYVYGSFIWDELARRRGAASVPAYVERQSAAPVPFLLDREAKRTFGITFSQAWRAWRDSVLRSLPDSVARAALAPVPLASALAREVPRGGRSLENPRWESDSSVVFVANTGREMPGVYRARVSPVPRAAVRLDRRNTLDVNAPAPGGTLVFAQSDFTDRFHLRSDLYVAHAGAAERLTRAARLSAPDVRADGSIVAVQTTPGATRLARVSRDGRTITPLTTAALDTQWTAPRWSPDGARIAAVRIARGVSAVVVLDSAGRWLATAAEGSAVLRSPAWTPDGRAIVYSSDESGASQLYAVSVGDAGVTSAPRLLTRDGAGVYGADVVALGADSLGVAATVLRADGYHVVTWTAPQGAVEPAPSSRAPLAPVPARDSTWRALTEDTAHAQRYSAWRSLLPAYWSPTVAQEARTGTLYGMLTSGVDAIGRHSYVAQALVNSRNGNLDASIGYQYNGLLEPILAFAVDQSWNYADIQSKSAVVGELERRERFASVHATFSRPRVRTYSSFTVGAELQERAYEATPHALLARLDPFYSAVHRYPTAVIGAAFSDAQRPTLSISPEDGVALIGAVRQRWETRTGDAGRSGVGIATLYKSLDLPGFAHHVIALRTAAGTADRRSPSVFDVGGVSGSELEIVPGVQVGTSARTFPIRGFAPGVESGISARAASLEYRAPLAMPSRGLGLFPLFVDRASLAVFGDAGRAACPAASTPACSPAANDGPTLASVGAELDIDSALQFDVPYRFRFGLAHPVRGAAYARVGSVTTYVTLGATF